MKEQFVPYELALKLKELGFNEECFGYYDNWLNYGKEKTIFRLGLCKGDIKVVPTPLWQQAFDWFRERYNHSGEVYFYSSADFGKWHFDIEPLKLDGERYTTPIKEGFETYNLARQACLEKLIEIFKK